MQRYKLYAKVNHNSNTNQNSAVSAKIFQNNNEIECDTKERGKVQRVNNIIFLLLLGRIAAEDLKNRRIPNHLVICMFIWGIYSSGMTGEWGSSVKGALLAGGSMLIFYMAFRRGIGAGDVKLLTVVGFYMGDEKIWELLFVIFLTAAVWGMLGRKGKGVPLAVCVFAGACCRMGGMM